MFDERRLRKSSCDPLDRIRKLLVVAPERLGERGEAKVRGLLAAGDPHGEVHEAWAAKEAPRDLYTFWGDEPVARQWLDGLINDCTTAAAAEVRGLARTLVQWREPILAWHTTTGHTGGPVEGLDSLIKNMTRIAAGFRSFPNYRLRILLACGGGNWDLLGTPPR
jgi:transposase